MAQFRANVAEESTNNLEKTYFDDFGLLKASQADGDNVVSGPSYLTASSDVMYTGTDKPYTAQNPTEQAKTAGTAPSENKIPLMLGAYQHPNFANADPAIKNINTSALGDKLGDEATKLLAEGTPLMSTSAPQPKLFQIGLSSAEPTARPHLPKREILQQPDGRIGYDPEARTGLPDPAQTFDQPYQPYAQDKTIADLNQKLKLSGIQYDIVAEDRRRTQTMQNTIRCSSSRPRENYCLTKQEQNNTAVKLTIKFDS